LTLGDKSGCGEGHLHGQLSALPVNFFTRILPVDLLVKRPEQGAAFSPQLFLKSPVQVRRELAYAPIQNWARLHSPVEDAESKDTRSQGPTQTPRWIPFHPYFIGLDRSAPSMKSRGHLGRSGFDF